ncbi:hypothetical protein BJ508DRAFT_309142 [Ascobolus immersus RN42]|uniref:Uncharacterized protein n=1 Tax=Ascobolus immersus RN42 TaxID=1160509 RepID=A0A3N4HXB9_ASCIM|nr:hypothetical protein BJ508DRAFT_309142 [Ascobolus immersus RN42]
MDTETVACTSTIPDQLKAWDESVRLIIEDLNVLHGQMLESLENTARRLEETEKRLERHIEKTGAFKNDMAVKLEKMERRIGKLEEHVDAVYVGRDLPVKKIGESKVMKVTWYKTGFADATVKEGDMGMLISHG